MAQFKSASGCESVDFKEKETKWMTATHNRNSTTNFICITMKIQYCKSYWALSMHSTKTFENLETVANGTEISKKKIKPGYSAQTGRGRITANQTTQFSNFGKLILRIPKRQLIASLQVKDNYYSMQIFLPFHWRRAHHMNCKKLPTNNGLLMRNVVQLFGFDK